MPSFLVDVIGIENIVRHINSNTVFVPICNYCFHVCHANGRRGRSKPRKRWCDNLKDFLPDWQPVGQVEKRKKRISWSIDTSSSIQTRTINRTHGRGSSRLSQHLTKGSLDNRTFSLRGDNAGVWGGNLIWFSVRRCNNQLRRLQIRLEY